MKLFVFIISVLFFSQPVHAEDAAAPEPTRIEADSENSQIRFYIDGELEAVLTKGRLHVREDIDFGGTVRDVGIRELSESDGINSSVEGEENAP